MRKRRRRRRRRGGEGEKLESKRKGLAETARGRQEGDMRGLASTRGFPNCAMSLSVIDRFASAINTGHQALATPSLSNREFTLDRDHPRIYSLQRLSLHPSYDWTILRRIYRSYPRRSVCVSLPLSLLLFPLFSAFSLSHTYTRKHSLSLSRARARAPSTRGGKPWPSKERQRANMALFPPSLGTPLLIQFLPPSPVFSSCYPLPPPVFSTDAFKLRWPIASLSFILLL